MTLSLRYDFSKRVYFNAKSQRSRKSLTTSPVPRHYKRSSPDVTSCTASAVFFRDVVSRVLTIGHSPPFTDQPTIQVLATQEADGDFAVVAIYVTDTAGNNAATKQRHACWGQSAAITVRRCNRSLLLINTNTPKHLTLSDEQHSSRLKTNKHRELLCDPNTSRHSRASRLNTHQTALLHDETNHKAQYSGHD